MNNSDNCGECGTPKSTNRFKEKDCPKCNSEHFVGFHPFVEKEVVNKKAKIESAVVEEVEEEVEDLVEV